MRPQHNAAENGSASEILAWAFRASMRPQHNAAENVPTVLGWLLVTQASMRPQHNAAENRSRARPPSPQTDSFNEAAA